MPEKSEKSFQEYLSNISDNQLIQFYDDLEWTPFPVLVIKEYQNRFKSKNKKVVLEKLKKHTEIAKAKSRILQSIAKKKGSTTTSKIKTKGKEIGEHLGETISPSYEKNLRILEKLGDLNKKGIITKKEFNQKKKELLRRI